MAKTYAQQVLKANEGKTIVMGNITPYRELLQDIKEWNEGSTYDQDNLYMPLRILAGIDKLLNP
ncbi:MAG: hypothetical protein AB7W16_15690 [Candidatus Obscuribacterales bacterium]